MSEYLGRKIQFVGDGHQDGRWYPPQQDRVIPNAPSVPQEDRVGLIEPDNRFSWIPPWMRGPYRGVDDIVEKVEPIKED